jgi:hypothetical protein
VPARKERPGHSPLKIKASQTIFGSFTHLGHDTRAAVYPELTPDDVNARERNAQGASRSFATLGQKGDSSTMTKHIDYAEFWSGLLPKGALVLFMVLCTISVSLSANAQGLRIVTFDAPGADMNPGDFNGTYPSGINVWGVITGAYQDTNSVFHGFLRSHEGKITSFEVPGADMSPYNGTAPSSINDLGAIAGSYYDANGFSHGFLRSPNGKFTSFDVPGVGGSGSTPLAINIEGAIVGYYTDSNFSFRSFVRSPDGKFTTWTGADACTGNSSEGCFGSGASNINAFGIIAGGFEDSSGNFVHHSFVRNANGQLKVFDVPGAGTGAYQGTGCPGCALGLNQFGAIAGIYSDSNSVNHGYFRSPDGKITTFDAPGAGTDTYEGTGCFSDCPLSLNNWGAVTGSYIDGNFVQHGYLRSSGGKIVTVDPAVSIYTFVDGINGFGAITGYYVDPSDVYHGFIALPCDHWCADNQESTTAGTSIPPLVSSKKPVTATQHNPRAHDSFAPITGPYGRHLIHSRHNVKSQTAK